MNGRFVISLDFELYWGVRDHRRLEDYGEHIKNVHQVVPALLELFRKYDIHCTWATVGFLLCRDKAELLQHVPARKPGYDNITLDPYRYIENNELPAVYHFAPELVQAIRHEHGQEIGTHTLSHFYAMEKGSGIDAFEADLEAALRLAQAKQLHITNIIFPRNQYGSAHLRACAAKGIKTFRGTEGSWLYHSRSRSQETAFRRLMRLADAYMNISGHHTVLPRKEEGLLNIPASRFLRPYNPKLNMLEPVRLRRIKRSMENAARQGSIYHLWWHPHNFGKHMEKNFAFLEKIFQHFDQLRTKHGMQPANMGEVLASFQING